MLSARPLSSKGLGETSAPVGRSIVDNVNDILGPIAARFESVPAQIGDSRTRDRGRSRWSQHTDNARLLRAREWRNADALNMEGFLLSFPRLLTLRRVSDGSALGDHRIRADNRAIPHH